LMVRARRSPLLRPPCADALATAAMPLPLDPVVPSAVGSAELSAAAGGSILRDPAVASCVEFAGWTDKFGLETSVSVVEEN
jgi:hypothetical protein